MMDYGLDVLPIGVLSLTVRALLWVGWVRIIADASSARFLSLSSLCSRSAAASYAGYGGQGFAPLRQIAKMIFRPKRIEVKIAITHRPPIQAAMVYSDTVSHI